MCRVSDSSLLASVTLASSLGLGGSSRHTEGGGPKPSSPGPDGGPSPNFSPIAHPVAVAEATQEPVESLMQKFKESFRANTPIEIGQLQSAPRSISAGRRKRRSRPRGRSPGHLWPGCPQLCPGSEGARKNGALFPRLPSAHRTHATVSPRSRLIRSPAERGPVSLGVKVPSLDPSILL